MKKNKKKNKPKVKKVCLYQHEALHTTNVVVEMLEDHLINHHYYNSGVNPEYNKLIDEAGLLLAEAYQAVGSDGV